MRGTGWFFFASRALVWKLAVLINRDKAGRDLFWLRVESLEEWDNPRHAEAA
jgi:hypothetical protein